MNSYVSISKNCRIVFLKYLICKFQSFVALFAVLAVASASVVVAPSAKIIQGPSTRTTVVGPDGSAISSVAPGGQIVQEESVGVVAETAPVVAAPAVAYSAPLVSAYAAPVVAAPLAYSAPILAGVAAQSTVDTVVAGPSGTIATGRTVASPLVASAPLVRAW